MVTSLSLPRVLFLALLPALSTALQPLKTVYHYPAKNGDWLGPRIPDHEVERLGHRRLQLAANSLRGDVALTTATGTCTQANGQAVGTCASPAKCNFAVDENVYGVSGVTLKYALGACAVAVASYRFSPLCSSLLPRPTNPVANE